MLLSNYNNYFRALAVRHALLQHNPASENGDGPPGSKHFSRFSADEVILGRRSAFASPALLLEPYEINTQGTNESPTGNFSGAFSVLASAAVEKMNEVEAAYDLAGSIMQDILAQMYQDEAAGACSFIFESVDFTSLPIMPIGPLFEKEFGWRCEFSFKQGFNITTPPAPGKFLAP